MKILSLHTDYIRFKPLKKAIKKIEDLSEEEKKEVNVTEALAVMIAVEKNDKDIKGIVQKLVEEIQNIANQVNVSNIVLYPYAHLSKDLAEVEHAGNVLIEAERTLKKIKGFKVWRAPFGYYKEFEMKVKGHPLSELSREIIVKGNEAEEKYDPQQLLREISKSKLDTSKLKENDHRIIGQQMDLFSFNEVAPGMVFWHNNGLIIYNELVNFWRELHRKANYEEISTPQILDSKLWKISGHWEKYKENIFLTEYEKRQFAVKPMNCPGGMLVYKTKPKSYKDLPLRVGELGVVHRQELSGTLGGLFRVIKFTQDDAHIFCNEEQLECEIAGVINLINTIIGKFGLKFDHVELSTRPEKRIGDEKLWDKAEKILESVLKNKKMKYKINAGDGAFYGPKIDFHFSDSQGRTWQCSTIQLDFAMPERFELEYIDKDNKKKRPVMIHRVIYGSLERFIGLIIEDSKGRLPTWIAPIQVRVLNLTDRNIGHCKKVIQQIEEAIPYARVDADFISSTMSSKVKEAEIMRIPYIITIGDKEEQAGNLVIRVRGDKKLITLTTNDFISKLKTEIEERR